MKNDEDLLIWWTTGADCREIGDPGGTDDEPDGRPLPVGCPAYIQEVYRSRLGRDGRGRLWVPDGIDIDDIRWDEYQGICRMIERSSAAGIVFRRADLASVAGLPGFVTDRKLEFIKVDGERSGLPTEG
jgi:hypothetical protein